MTARWQPHETLWLAGEITFVDAEDRFVASENLPEPLAGARYYEPTCEGRESAAQRGAQQRRGDLAKNDVLGETLRPHADRANFLDDSGEHRPSVAPSGAWSGVQRTPVRIARNQRVLAQSVHRYVA